MGVDDFSSASQWAPLARDAQKRKQELSKEGSQRRKKKDRRQRQGGDSTGNGWGVVGSLRRLVSW